MKPHFLDRTKRVLTFGQPTSSDTRDDSVVDPPHEFTVAGRHYRLVPVDSSEESGATAPSAAELLTPRELQIVALVADGNVNKQVADVLRISEWTVSTHLRRIFAKLGVDTRAAMVSRCLDAMRFKATLLTRGDARHQPAAIARESTAPAERLLGRHVRQTASARSAPGGTAGAMPSRMPENQRDVRVGRIHGQDPARGRDEERRDTRTVPGDVAVGVDDDADGDGARAPARTEAGIHPADRHEIAEAQRAQPEPAPQPAIRELDVGVAEHAFLPAETRTHHAGRHDVRHWHVQVRAVPANAPSSQQAR